MPTVDYIRETVDDRFYERGGETPRPPRLVPCPVCAEQLLDEAALAAHLGSAHPLTAPRLLIDGEVVVGERVIHRRQGAGTVDVANATELIVSENGRQPQPWSIAALRETLADVNAVVLDITLRNGRADGASASEEIRLTLNIPDAVALDAADRCFEEFLARDDLDEHWLDRFADEIAELAGAGRYASALHEYGVAILIKDNAQGTSDSIPFAAHRDKLQRALSVLRHFPERSVARAVCGFIRFGLNDLSAGIHAAGVPPLDECTAALQVVAGVQPLSVDPVAGVLAAGRCPTDTTTALILDRWRESGAAELLTDLAARGTTTPEDATKCRVLALRAAAKDSSAAQDLARALANDPVFGAWATQIVEDDASDG